MTRSEQIEKIELTEEEIRLAIWQAKFTKWNALRFKDYWEELEKVKPKNNANQGSEVQKGKGPSKPISK